MRIPVLMLLAVVPVVEKTECGKVTYDEPATCVKICTEQLKKKVWAVKPLSWPVTDFEKEAVPQGRVCACYTEREVVTDGVKSVNELPPEKINGDIFFKEEPHAQKWLECLKAKPAK